MTDPDSRSEKVESDTPRTDATITTTARLGDFASTYYVPIDFARQLERENRHLSDMLKQAEKELEVPLSATPERLGRAFDQALAECTGSILSQYSANLIRKRANAIVAADNRRKE